MSNRLARETSPYLKQHADNPVDWYPWGEEALKAAREQDKPILLSIGYSACHWCHVMAHESFEDAEVAALMNKHFINVKVDREERPDLDQIYQAAHNVITSRRGGWPLTMFLLPDQTPFFAGTYFPKTPRLEKPGMMDLLPQIAASYHDGREDIEKRSQALRDALTQTQPAAAGDDDLTAATLDAALARLKQMFDPVDGGLTEALKFPHPAEIEFCLRRAAELADTQAMDMVKLTLTRMAERGLYDQFGGGFYRYCVDQQWVIPHFEKMLYDNGPLLRLYSDMWLVDRQPLYARVVADTATWVMCEMQAQGGGYYSTLDADSEHEEGKFYVWTPAEVKAALSAEEYAVVAPHYGLDAPPNFEDKHWHLQVATPLAQVAQRLAIPLDRANALLDSTRARLLTRRERRVRPARDEKILTAWNALMVKGMVRASRVFAQPIWLNSARRTVEFIRANLWRDGRLLVSYKDGKATLNGYLDDYAFLLDALLELMQADFRNADLEWARAGRCPAGAIRRPRTRRVLFRQPRPRATDAPRQNRPTQRHPLRQQRGGAGARPSGPRAWRTALQRGRASHRAGVCAAARATAQRARHSRYRARRTIDAAYPRRAERRRRCAGVATRHQRTVFAARARTGDSARSSGAAGGAGQTRRRRPQGMGMPGRNLPAAHHRPRGRADRDY